jgi:uridine phosphorylase
MVDRCNCLTPLVERQDGTFEFEPRLTKRTVGVFVAVSGTRQKFRAAQQVASAFFCWANAKLAGTILYAHDDNDVGGVKDDKEQMDQAFAIGTELVNSHLVADQGQMAPKRAAGPKNPKSTNWFDPSGDVVLDPETDRKRWWQGAYGVDRIEVAPQVVFAVNRHGHFFDAVCEAVDQLAVVVHDHRSKGYVHYRTASSAPLTVYQSPIPAPWAAQALELLISAGAKEIVFVNGAGALQPDLVPGSIVLPGRMVREEGTSFHYAPADVLLHTSETLNNRIRTAADSLGVNVSEGKHWTTDAIYRETWGKVERLRNEGVVSVDMELSALAGVVHYRRCELSSLLVVTDVLSRPHTWNGTTSAQFQQGVNQVAQIAARVFCTDERR